MARSAMANDQLIGRSDDATSKVSLKKTLTRFTIRVDATHWKPVSRINTLYHAMIHRPTQKCCLKKKNRIVHAEKNRAITQ